MNILLAFLVVFSVALIAFICLSVFSRIFAVKENPLKKNIRECLPGINCGACGYNGCDDYAEALAEKGEKPVLCIPGGQAVANQISEILGVEPEPFQGLVALVHCNGTCHATFPKAEYQGVQTCKGASMLYGGSGACHYSCLGFGDCANACPNDAICMVDGIAHVDPRKCLGCRLCVKTCPKNIISMIPQTAATAVVCSNKQKGAQARKVCKNACIGCKKCEKTCPHGAITVANNLASIDYTKCTNCGECAKVCPTGCIHSFPAAK